MCFTDSCEVPEEGKSGSLDSPLKTVNINVKLDLTTESSGNSVQEAVLDAVETDIIMNLPVHVTKSKDIIMQSVITQLALRGYNMDNAKIWFYSKLYGDYVDCGLEPSSRYCPVTESEAQDNFLHLRIQVESANPEIASKSLSSALSSFFTGPDPDPELFLMKHKDDEETSIRTKDRTVEEVMLRVAAWRKLFVGCTIPGEKRVKCTLDEAAKIVKMPKKTLDDHLQQIRKAVENKFDFNQNRDKPKGAMRRYAKKNKYGE